VLLWQLPTIKAGPAFVAHYFVVDEFLALFTLYSREMSMLSSRTSALLVAFASLGLASAQTFRRLGTCPTLGCVFPPDQTDFLAGQLFDIRLEVHAPVNGSEASNNGVPDENFKFCIQSDKGSCTDVAKFFNVQDSVLEKWSFSSVFSSVMTILWTYNQKLSYFEDLFAKDAGTPNLVNVASKAYRGVSTSHWPINSLPANSFFTQLALTKVLDSIGGKACHNI